MASFVDPIIIVLLLGVILFQNEMHRLERKEMVNRLMARDYHEYAQLQKPSPPKKKENWLKRGIKDAYRTLHPEDDDE